MTRSWMEAWTRFCWLYRRYAGPNPEDAADRMFTEAPVEGDGRRGQPFPELCRELAAYTETDEQLEEFRHAPFWEQLFAPVQTAASPDGEPVREAELFRWTLALQFALAVKLRSGVDGSRRCEELFESLCRAHGFHGKPAPGAWDYSDPETIAVYFDALAPCPRKEDELRKWEVRGLCLWLLGHDLPTAHSVRITVVTDRDGSGHTGVLQVDVVESGPSGYVRHPSALLIARDATFEQSFADAEAFLTGSGLPGSEHAPKPIAYEWRGSPQRWERELLRWQLSTAPTAPPLHILQGGSIGGSIGVASLLALMREETDLFTAITSRIDARGALSGRVDGLPEKLKALQEKEGDLLIISKTQLFPAVESRLLAACADVVTAAERFAARGRTRSGFLAAVREDHQWMPLPGDGAPVALENLYVATPILAQAEVRHPLPERNGEPGTASPAEPSYRSTEDELQATRLQTRATMELEAWITQLGTSNRQLHCFHGPPGSGKSTLLRWVAWKLANSPGFGGGPTGRSLIPVFVRLDVWDRQDRPSLPSFMLHLVNEWDWKRNEPTSSLEPRELRSLFERWAARGELLLLLDGLDQISESAARDIAPRLLGPSVRCTAVISCRTLTSVERFRQIDPDTGRSNAPVYTCMDLGQEHQEQYVRRYVEHVLQLPVEASEQTITALGSYLGSMESVRMIASNPLILSLVCFLVQDGIPAPQLPRSRVCLYEEVVRRILGRVGDRCRECRDPELRGHLVAAYELVRGDEKSLRAVLQELSLRMMPLNGRRALVFPRQALVTALRSMAVEADRILQPESRDSVAEVLRRHAASTVKALFAVSGLLVREGDDGRFLHLSLQEYLAASALAEVISRREHGLADLDTWTRTLGKIAAEAKADRTPPATPVAQDPAEALVAHVDRAAWLPEWQMVLVFLAGILARDERTDAVLPEFLAEAWRPEWSQEHPRPVSGVADRDDLFRHRLALAGHCVAEAWDVAHDPWKEAGDAVR